NEASAAMGVFTVRTALLGKPAAADVILPAWPLGAMHGDAAGRALEAAGATVRTGRRVESLDELDADAVVVAVPPVESARLLGEADLLWSRVGREPYATVALRPGTQAERRATATERPDVVRAGAWTDTGWPATMEGAVRSGLAAARRITAMQAGRA